MLVARPLLFSLLFFSPLSPHTQYLPDEATKLKAYGELPETFGKVEGEAGGDGDEDDLEFDFDVEGDLAGI